MSELSAVPEEFDYPEITVEWRWQMRPFWAHFERASGGVTGVCRWTPSAARQRAMDLRDVYADYRRRGRQEDRRQEMRLRKCREQFRELGLRTDRLDVEIERLRDERIKEARERTP